LPTISGSETGSPWDDTPGTDILVFLTAAQEAADGVPLGDQLVRQAAELAERVGVNATFFWPEKRIIRQRCRSRQPLPTSSRPLERKSSA
jgi:hypothetical protein